MDYTNVYDKAMRAGGDALVNCKPTPVAWVSVGLDDKPLNNEVSVVDEGDCGGAYIILHDSRSEFVKWAKKNNRGSIEKNMGKGYTLSTRDARPEYRGQSFERYVACANAVAEILKENGISCHVRSYLT